MFLKLLSSCKIFILFCVLFFYHGLASYGQDTLYYSGSRQVYSIDSCNIYQVIKKVNDTLITREAHSKDGHLENYAEYSKYNKNEKIQHGKLIIYNKDGFAYHINNFKNGKVEGKQIHFINTDIGQIKTINDYSAGKLLNKQCFDSLGNEL